MPAPGEPKRLNELVYSVLRGHYVLQLHGVYRLGDRVEIAMQGLPKSKRKIWAATLPLEYDLPITIFLYGLT